MKTLNKIMFLAGLFVLLLETFVYGIVITTFNSADMNISLLYPSEKLTKAYTITIPNGTVSEARMKISGSDISGKKTLPADAVLVTDVSGSMDDNCGSDQKAQLGETPCKINDAKNASLTFLENVDLDVIHIGLVHYSYWNFPYTALDTQLTSIKKFLVKNISKYQADGWTNMGGGMKLAINELLSSRAQPGAPKYMVLLTDGMANCYAKGSPQCPPSGETPQYIEGGANYSREMAELAKSNGIIIFGIAFGNDANKELIKNVSLTTGGKWFETSDPATLRTIYEDIAVEISVTNFTTPTINSSVPKKFFGWKYNTEYSGNNIWNNAVCGGGDASCSDYRNVIQQNLNFCPTNPCTITFSAFSSTVGRLDLSDLYIEINEPPVTNIGPTGKCKKEDILCGQTSRTVDIDDGSMVTDPNDAPDELTWKYKNSIESSGGAFFSNNSDFNTIRQIIFDVDSAHLNEAFWETFFYNVSDPSQAYTEACINVTYEGCGILKVQNDSINFNSTQTTGYDYNLSNLIAVYSVSGPPGKLKFDILGLTSGKSVCFSFTIPTLEYITNIDALNSSKNCTEVVKVNISAQNYSYLGSHIANLTINFLTIPKNINLEDASITFDYSSFPGHKYNLSDMLVDKASLPCPIKDINFVFSSPTKFAINGPDPEISNITIVPLPDWTTTTSEKITVTASCTVNSVNYIDSANLDITYTAAGAPNGKISCISVLRKILRNTPSTINLDEMFGFSGDYGEVNKLTEDSGPKIEITPILPDKFEAKSLGLSGEEIVNIKLYTNNGIVSDTCPIRFLGVNTKCNKGACIGCADYDCFISNDCVERGFAILNGGTVIRILDIIPASLTGYTVASFEPLPSSGFTITPIDSQRFLAEGDSLPHNTRDIATMKLNFPGYSEKPQACAELIRVTYNIGDLVYDPESDLLITGSKSITGFFEKSGLIKSKGPYIFTAKVWQRK